MLILAFVIFARGGFVEVVLCDPRYSAFNQLATFVLVVLIRLITLFPF